MYSVIDTYNYVEEIFVPLMYFSLNQLYEMPDPIPPGEILKDFTDKKWKLGVLIGKGGFGEIYCAQQYDYKESKEFPYIIKISCLSSYLGSLSSEKMSQKPWPLSVERACYMNISKTEDVIAFKYEKNLAHLGVPRYLGFGVHEHNGQKYGFLLLERLGADILKLFLDNNKVFPEDTVFKIGIQILDVLEYIHSKGYVHGDVKAANILLDKTKSQVYLIDFEMSSHYAKTEKFEPDPEKAHNGTIEYLSRDAHLGVQSRRGDLESLLYNLIYWFTGTLPWEDLSDNNEVHKMKDNHFKDLQAFLSSCFGDDQPPDALVNFLNYITKLEFDQDPDYAEMHEILVRGLKTAGGINILPVIPVGSEKGAKRTTKDKTEETVPAKKAEEKPSDDMPQENENGNLKAGIEKKKIEPVSKEELLVEPLVEEKVNPKRGRGKKRISEPVDDNEQLDQPQVEENGGGKRGRGKKKVRELVIKEEQLDEPKIEENGGGKRGRGKKKVPEPVIKDEQLDEPKIEENGGGKRGRGKKKVPEPVIKDEQLDEPKIEENGGGKRGRGKKKVPELVIKEEQLDEPKIEENGGGKRGRGKKKVPEPVIKDEQLDEPKIEKNGGINEASDGIGSGRQLRIQKKVDISSALMKEKQDIVEGSTRNEEMLKKGGAQRNAKKINFDESEDEAISPKPTTTKRGQKIKK